jgi:UDPglucose 6-dehydrogenase
VARICIVGSGYVGLVTGACFADFGHEVACVDINAQRIATLQRGDVPFYEPGLDVLVRRNQAARRLRFTTTLEEDVAGADVIMIAVQTPSGEQGEADLSHVLSVGRQVGTLLPPDGYRVIVTKSTVPVGTSRTLEQAVRAAAPPGAEFDVASNPEFLREGSAIEDFMRPDRVVIGVQTERAGDLMRELYRPLFLLETPIVVTSIQSAELVKYASNAFLAVKISFINEIANLCERVGADVGVVARTMGLDRRIGSKFLHAGLGFGGSCLPKDTRAITYMAQEHGEQMGLVEAAIRVNEQRVVRAVQKLEELGGDLKGRTVALLGLAFKPNTDDLREAPSLRLIPMLRERGARVRACDPEATQSALRIFPDLETCDDVYECARAADACMLVTEWNPYREIDLARLKAVMRGNVFVDCRNVYPPHRMRALGFHYESFGR